jgi:hypothetical protein
LAFERIQNQFLIIIHPSLAFVFPNLVFSGRVKFRLSLYALTDTVHHGPLCQKHAIARAALFGARYSRDGNVRSSQGCRLTAACGQIT